MKTPVLYRFVMMMFVMALSVSGFANNSIPLRENKADVALSLQERPAQEQPPQDDRKPERERPKPDVKEVPKSRRMPKPKAVVDRVKQNRPPVKVVRPRGIKRNLRVFQ